MRREEHVGLGLSYAGFGGPYPSSIPSPPRTPRTPTTPRGREFALSAAIGGSSSQGGSPSATTSPRFGRSRRREKTAAPTSLLSKQSFCRPSTWLVLFVLALSAGVKYVLHKDPSLHNRLHSRLAKLWRPQDEFRYSLLWMAPILSGGGYCSEALTFVDALNSSERVKKLRINHHGAAENVQFWKGLPPETRKTLLFMLSGDISLEDSVIVCHSEPDAWYPPLFQTDPCPPKGYSVPRYVIGRTILETSSHENADHVERCNKMNEIWVPTQHHVQRFLQAGVYPSKIVKVVQAVDTHFFDPAKVRPSVVFFADSKIVFHPYTRVEHSGKPFVFLSIFKWESRKGWDVLLSAFLQEFTAEQNVILYIVTNPCHPRESDDFIGAMREFVLSLHLHEPSSGWARVHVIDADVPQALLPGLYKAADCFVLPSRGEGWGRPIVEAMAMELPVIASNLSGMTEYMSDRNSYPLKADDMSEILQGPFKDHYWAEPSKSRLMMLLRRVVNNPKEAKQKGKRARQDMVAKYSPEVVAEVVLQQLLRIQRELDSQEEI